MSAWIPAYAGVRVILPRAVAVERVAMPELQVRLPYTAWGAGEEWQDGYENLLADLSEALEAAGVGGVDDPDHFDDFICFYLDGNSVDELRGTARQVLTRHGLLDTASGFVTDPEAGDWQVGSPLDL
jgi:hypothetical protein